MPYVYVFYVYVYVTGDKYKYNRRKWCSDCQKNEILNKYLRGLGSLYK